MGDCGRLWEIAYVDERDEGVGGHRLPFGLHLGESPRVEHAGLPAALIVQARKAVAVRAEQPVVIAADEDDVHAWLRGKHATEKALP